MSKEIYIYSDGGSRGNPGEAACGFVVIDGGVVVQRQRKYLGIRTNNEAEYEGLLIALSWIKENVNNYSDCSFIFHLDSELIVKQINGKYKVKSKHLSLLYKKALGIAEKISNDIKFVYVPREKNKLADSLVNEELNEKL